MAGLAGGGASCPTDSPLPLLQKHLGVLKQLEASRRQLEPPPTPRPKDELRSDLRFKHLNLTAKGWLGDVEALRRPPEMAFLGQGDKEPEAIEFYGRHIELFNLQCD